MSCPRFLCCSCLALALGTLILLCRPAVSNDTHVEDLTIPKSQDLETMRKAWRASVTLKYEKIALFDLIEDLSKQSGVKIQVDRPSVSAAYAGKERSGGGSNLDCSRYRGAQLKSARYFLGEEGFRRALKPAKSKIKHMGLKILALSCERPVSLVAALNLVLRKLDLECSYRKDGIHISTPDSLFRELLVSRRFAVRRAWGRVLRYNLNGRDVSVQLALEDVVAKHILEYCRKNPKDREWSCAARHSGMVGCSGAGAANRLRALRRGFEVRYDAGRKELAVTAMRREILYVKENLLPELERTPRVESKTPTALLRCERPAYWTPDPGGDPLPWPAVMRMGGRSIGHRNPVGFATASRDGRLIATVGYEGNVAVWDALRSDKVLAAVGDRFGRRKIDFSPDGKQLAVTHPGKWVSILDIGSGRERVLDTGHRSTVQLVAFSGDGGHLITASKQDTSARIFDLKAGRTRREVLLHNGIKSMVLGPKRSRLAVGIGYGPPLPAGIRVRGPGLFCQGVDVWDLETGARIGKRIPASEPLAFSPDGSRLVAIGTNGSTGIWEIETGERVLELDPKAGRCDACDFHPGGKAFVTTTTDTFCLWQFPSGKLTRSIRVPGAFLSCPRYAADGKNLMICDSSRIRRWEIATGRELASDGDGHRGRLNDAVVHPNGKLFASAGSDGHVLLWDLTTGKQKGSLKHEAHVGRMAFSPNGDVLATVSGSRVMTKGTVHKITLWETSTGNRRADFSGKDKYSSCIKFSPDGSLLAASWSDDRVNLLDPKTGKGVRLLKGHEDTAWNVAFSRDGTSLLTMSVDSTARVWRVRDGKLKHVLRHPKPVWSGAFSPDGKRVATGTYDSFIRIWDAETGQLIRSFEAHPGGNVRVRYARSGKVLISEADDGVRRVWRMSPDKPTDGSGLLATWQETKHQQICDPEIGLPLLEIPMKASRVWLPGRKMFILYTTSGTILKCSLFPKPRLAARQWAEKALAKCGNDRAAHARILQTLWEALRSTEWKDRFLASERFVAMGASARAYLEEKLRSPSTELQRKQVARLSREVFNERKEAAEKLKLWLQTAELLETDMTPALTALRSLQSDFEGDPEARKSARTLLEECIYPSAITPQLRQRIAAWHALRWAKACR